MPKLTVLPMTKAFVCSGSTLFASKLNSSVILGNYLQLTTSADNIFRCIFILCALRVKLKFHTGTHKYVGTKVYSNGIGPMIKMTVNPIYDKQPLKSSFIEPESK